MPAYSFGTQLGVPIPSLCLAPTFGDREATTGHSLAASATSLQSLSNSYFPGAVLPSDRDRFL